MKTIQEVFSENLRRLRGSASQSDMAKKAGVPLASYIRSENGDIPQRVNLEKIAKAFGVPETHLFVDRSEFKLGQPTVEEALEVLREQILAAAERPQDLLKREAIELLSTLKNSQVDDLLPTLRAAAGLDPGIISAHQPAQKQRRKS